MQNYTRSFAALLLLVLLLGAGVFVQVPQAINYQAIARDAGGTPYANRNISVRFTINTGINPGFPVYQENANRSNQPIWFIYFKNRLWHLTIGSFPAISWAGGNKYLLVEFDPNGGTSYLNMGSSEMVSVPYALYAERSGGT